MWAFVVEAFVPASGAPVTEKVARSVVRPAPNEAKAWVGGVNEEVPLERDVAVRVGLGTSEVELDIGSFGGGGEVGISRAGQGEVRGGAARAGGGVDSNSTGGSDCPTEE